MLCLKPRSGSRLTRSSMLESIRVLDSTSTSSTGRVSKRATRTVIQSVSCDIWITCSLFLSFILLSICVILKGWPGESTWEPMSHIEEYRGLVKEFEARRKKYGSSSAAASAS